MFELFSLGKKLIHLPEVDSTNRLAGENARAGEPEGTVYLTDYQSKGKGQSGNHWESEAGQNLTFSLLLRPVFLAPSDLVWLNEVASLAVYDLVTQLTGSDQVRIKWPNDVLVNGRKISGILIENQLEGAQVKASVVGIGLNVNQVFFSERLNFPATSLKMVSGHAFQVREVLSLLLEILGQYYFQLAQGEAAAIREKYEKHLFGLGERLPVRVGEETGLGEVVGVQQDGRLRMIWKGASRVFDLSEIKFLPGQSSGQAELPA